MVDRRLLFRLQLQSQKRSMHPSIQTAFWPSLGRELLQVLTKYSLWGSRLESPRPTQNEQVISSHHPRGSFTPPPAVDPMNKTLFAFVSVIAITVAPISAVAQSLPITVGMNYGVARQRLIQAGWQPLVPSFSDIKWNTWSEVAIGGLQGLAHLPVVAPQVCELDKLVYQREPLGASPRLVGRCRGTCHGLPTWSLEPRE